jgi:hypothetical protein
VGAVIFGLLGLPVAVWLDLRVLSESMLRTQAAEISRIIDEMRGYYGSDVVGRVAQGQPTTTAHNYRDVPGAIPIPATLSIELGKRISAQDGSVKYRFVSDMPFRGREVHELDAFEQAAIRTLRSSPDQPLVEVSGSIFDRNVRAVAPVKMGQVCVSCHNSHPDSPKRDWKVGDVRGIQEVTVAQPIAANVFSFKYLLAYFALAALAGGIFILLQLRQAALIRGMNRDWSVPCRIMLLSMSRMRRPLSMLSMTLVAPSGAASGRAIQRHSRPLFVATHRSWCGLGWRPAS